MADPNSIFDGFVAQKNPEFDRDENNVRKSDMDIFRYIAVVICPYESRGIPNFARTLVGDQESRHRASKMIDDSRATAARREADANRTLRFHTAGSVDGITLS
jgi:hypothetical protein